MFRFLLLEYSSIVDSLYSVAIVCLFFLNGKVEPVLFSDVNESNCSRLCLERLNPKIPRRIVFFFFLLGLLRNGGQIWAGDRERKAALSNLFLCVLLILGRCC